MTKLFAFGDSFVVGDLDDFGENDCNYNPNYPPQHNMGYDERLNYLKYNVSFASLLAKHFNLEFENLAERGSSNYLQLDRFSLLISKGKIKPNDIVLFGITHSSRDRLSLIEHQNSPEVGTLGVIFHEIRTDPEKLYMIEHFDFFYILSVLESFKKKYRVNILAFNLFYNTVHSGESLDYEFNFLLGSEYKNNTLVDLINDTWGSNLIKNNTYHTHMDIPKGYESFYTWNKHPSELGHKKIKEWFVRHILDLGIKDL